MPQAAKPEFPIRIRFFPENEVESYYDVEELETDLEFFDSEDAQGGRVEVTDRLGRRVILKVWELKLTVFKLYQPLPNRSPLR